MTYLVGVPLLALAAVLQGTVVPRLPLFGGTIDLVLLLSLSWTLAGEWQGGVIWGLFGGLCLDLLSGGPFGGAALGLVLTAYLASLSEGRFWRSHVLLPLATVLAGSVVYHGVQLIVLTASGYPVSWGYSLLHITLPTILLNTLVMLPVYNLVRGLHAFIHPAPVAL